MNEISGNIEAVTYRPDWRGIEEVQLLEVEGTFIVKIERRWIGVQKTVVLNEQQVKWN